MATNPPSGDGHRNGAVKGRSDFQSQDRTMGKTRFRNRSFYGC